VKAFQGNDTAMKKLMSLVLVFGAFFFAGCSTTHRDAKWEYQMVHTIAGVNERAEKGWSVVSVVVKPDGTDEYLLRRRKQ
jgi:hypothetical protein